MRSPTRTGLPAATWIVVLLLPLLCALASSGCGGPDLTRGTVETPSGPPLSAADIERAVARMTEAPPPMPLPPSRVLTVDTSVTRYAALLAETDSTTGWKIPASDPFVATVGPASTRRPGSSARLHNYTIWGVELQALDLWGFEIEAAEVGQILIRARVVNSPYFVFNWLETPGMRIEVSQGSSVSEYAISTDGLARWEGRIRRISLMAPIEEGRPPPEIEIELLGFVRRGSAYAAAAGVERVRIDRVVREALFLHGTTRLTFPAAELPSPARLSFGASVLGEPLRLRVAVDSPEGRTTVVEEEISDPAHWLDFHLDLPQTAGPARLSVEVEGPPESILFLSNLTSYSPRRSPQRVIFYLVDTLGALHTSLDGYHRETTPELARLAAEGALFGNAFANAAYTAESVPSLMTSLHTRSHGLTEIFQRLSPDFLTLQQAFQAAGWATAAFSTNANAGPGRATDLGFDSFYDHLAFGGYEAGLRTAPIDQIVSWLETHRDRSAFLYIHTAEPHSPYEPPPPFKHLFDPEYNSRMGRLPVPQGLAVTYDHEYTPRELEQLVALYDGEVAFADYVMGSLHRLLQQRGLLENALLVVTADHGEEFMEQGRLGHGVGVNTHIVKVPLVFWGKNVPPGTVVAENVQLLDLTPTLLDLQDITAEAPFQGQSLVPLLSGQTAGFDRRPIFAATYLPTRPRFTMIEGSWKLNVQAPGEYTVRLELFDLATDPGEQHDLAAERPEVLGAMLRKMAKLYGDLPRYEGQTAQRHEISQEQIERLRALGYLQ